MRTEARFPGVGEGSGHYESFYIKATRPGGGQGLWIRHTVHKPPDEQPSASVWLTLFDADSSGPRATKLTVPAAELSAPPGAYIEIDGARLEPGGAHGQITGADGLTVSWDLELVSQAEAFHHLPSSFLYSAPLPKTKLLSPHPDGRWSGIVVVDGRETEIDGWPGMVGHNWGSEHAERWAWIQANEFRETDGYFDAGLGRIKLGPADHSLDRQRRALVRRRASSPRRASVGFARPASTTSRPSASSSSPEARSGFAAGSHRSHGTSSAGSMPTPRARSTTRSTARSPTWS